MTETKGLTPKQQRFVEEYLVDLNATQAAIRAGYSAKTANVQAAQLLTKLSIAQAIQEAMQARSERTQITADRVLEELAKIGFADIRRAVRWGEGVVVTDPDTGEVRIANGVLLIDSADIDSDTAATIAEVSQTQAGLKVKFHDKRAALVDLGKHLGLFKDRPEAPSKGQELEGKIIDGAATIDWKDLRDPRSPGGRNGIDALRKARQVLQQMPLRQPLSIKAEGTRRS